MNEILLRPIFRAKYIEEQKKNKFNKGGLASIQKFAEGGLSKGERTAITLAPFVQALTGAQTMPGESEASSFARAFGQGLGGLGQAKKTIAAIDQVEAEKIKNLLKAKEDQNKEKREIEKEFRKTWRDSKVVKNFEDAQAGYSRVVAGANQDSKAGDIALIFGFMKTLDPTSVVRESEFSLGENVGSFGGKVKAYWDSFTGAGRLTPEQRREILNASTQQFGTYQTELDTFKVNFNTKGKELGFDAGKAMLTADRRPKEIVINGKKMSVPMGTRLIQTKRDETGKLISVYQMPNGYVFGVDARKVD
jgi:hypothetical protein